MRRPLICKNYMPKLCLNLCLQTSSHACFFLCCELWEARKDFPLPALQCLALDQAIVSNTKCTEAQIQWNAHIKISLSSTDLEGIEDHL